MTRGEIIRLAEEAGFEFARLSPVLDTEIVEIWLAAMAKFASLVAAAEREACAWETDSAYRQRNQLVALLSTLFPAGKATTSIEGWDEAWNGCVYIEFPWGQASWHYHKDDEEMFAHLPPYEKNWDGHSTEEKYSKISDFICSRGKE